MYITYVKLPLSTSTLRVLNPSMVSIMTRGSSWGCLIPFTSCLEKIMSSFQGWQYFFFHWVLDMDIIHLPLNRLLRGLIWSSNDWSPNDRPSLSQDWLKIVPIFLSLVVSWFLLCFLASLIVVLNKILELPKGWNLVSSLMMPPYHFC